MTLKERKDVVLDALDLLVEDTSADSAIIRALEEIQTRVENKIDELWSSMKRKT